MIRKDRNCEECFNQAAITRFKTNLRTNLKIWKDDNNLICVSGGDNSMAMLHLMHVSLFGEAQRKMFFKVHIIHIDDSAVFGWDEQKTHENISIVVDACKKFGFNYTVLKIESVFDIKTLNPNTKKFDKDEEEKKDYVNQVFDSSPENRERLQEILKYPSELCSNKEDMIFFFKKWVLLDFALKFGFKKLLLGCSAVNITSKVMSEIAKGRGLSLPNDVTFVDDRYLEDIKFMNPMRDYLKNELDIYNRMHDIKIIDQKPFSLMEMNKGKNLPGYGSMNLLCEDFINLLQESNEQTVHTVLRTSNKLKIGLVEDQEKNF
jgi:cytoplasmic tRNA 2-thiolation protein 2